MNTVQIDDARIEGRDGRLALENSFVRREILLSGRLFATASLVNVRTGRQWVCADTPDAPSAVTFGGDEQFLSHFTGEPRVTLSREDSPLCEAPHLLACVEVSGADASLRRWYQIYPGCPAVVCWTEVSGCLETVAPRPTGLDVRGRVLRPEGTPGHTPRADLHDGLILPDRHLRIRNVRFQDCTDFTDNYVQCEERLACRSALPWLLEGNLLLAQSLRDGEGLFLLKESPILADQPDHPDADFVYTFNSGLLAQVGWGVQPEDLASGDGAVSWRTVTGVYDSTEWADSQSVKSYLERRSRRNWLLTCNQWGDRGDGKQFTEPFVRSEINACARLGIEAYMLDAGWQRGNLDAVNKDCPDGSSPFHDVPGFWDVDLAKFPNGLKPLADFASQKGVQLLFWYNPDHTDQNRNWEKDADTMLRLWRECGVKVFKIDGVWMLTALAMRRTRAMLQKVVRETGGEVSFQLDITNGARWGFLGALDMGALFVENRYAHWQNYFPHQVLRNLWQLSRWVRPQNLQFEFLNNSPERGQYYLPLFGPSDPFTPDQYGLDYLFACTMFANPLAWFEPSRLSPAQQELLWPAIEGYLKVRDEIFTGDIYPIGPEPSGRSITGFQSHREADGAGYVCVYREVTDCASAEIALRRLAPGAGISLELVMGCAGAAPAGPLVRFTLPEMRSWALFRYRTR